MSDSTIASKMAMIAWQPDMLGSKIDPTDAAVSCQVETNFADIVALRHEWDEAVLKLGAPVYMTFDWLNTWWKVYGASCDLRILIFRFERQLVGLFPLYLESFFWGPFRVKIARLVGANIPPKVFNPPIDEHCAPQVISATLKRLFDIERCDLFSFGPVSGSWRGQLGMEGLQSGILSHRFEFRAHDVQTLFWLPQTFDLYLEGLTGTERKNRLKRTRQLEKNHAISLDVVSGLNAVSELDAFMDLHKAQWSSIGKGGHFEAWPKSEDFNRMLVSEQACHNRVRFYRMLADGKVVVSRYTFLHGKTLFSELPARAVGDEWNRFGIGTISMLKFNQQVIESGISEVDSGLGGYDHKASLGGTEIPVGVWHIRSSRAWSNFKAKSFVFISRAILFVCRKVWYRRIVPRLPKTIPRRQSLKWLRFDV